MVRHLKVNSGVLRMSSERGIIKRVERATVYYRVNRLYEYLVRTVVSASYHH